MNDLFIRLPAQAACSGALDTSLTQWQCNFATQDRHGARIQAGRTALDDLTAAIAAAERVVLLLSATDVTLLHLPVPPMSAAKLRFALPNLVEEHLLGEVSDAAIACSAPENGFRLIAIVQREWLAELARTFTALGAKQLQALPFQLCLPVEDKTLHAALEGMSRDIDLSVRLSRHEGLGILCAELTDAWDALNAIARERLVSLSLPEQHADFSALFAGKIALTENDWPTWIANAGQAIDLMSSLPSYAERKKPRWRHWWWPVRLAIAVAVFNIVALNLHWWMLAREAANLHHTMDAHYRAAFPKEVVVIDPLAQTRQKIASAELAVGQPAPDSFIALCAHFGAAWSSLDAAPKISEIDYRDRHLLVHFADSGAAQNAMAQLKLAAIDGELSVENIDPATLRIGERQ